MKRSAACLRLFGETLDPDEITRLLGKPPSDAHRKGDVVGPRKNRVARQGSWRLRAVDREPGDLDSQIEEIFSDLTNDLSIWRQIGQTSSIDLFCGIFLGCSNEEFYFSPTAMTKLGERGIVLTLDTYTDVDPSEEPTAP